jgi:hypothetical protein
VSPDGHSLPNRYAIRPHTYAQPKPAVQLPYALLCDSNSLSRLGVPDAGFGVPRRQERPGRRHQVRAVRVTGLRDVARMGIIDSFFGLLARAWRLESAQRGWDTRSGTVELCALAIIGERKAIKRSMRR